MKRRGLFRMVLACLVAACPVLCAGPLELLCCDDAGTSPGSGSPASSSVCFCSGTLLPAARPTTVTMVHLPLFLVEGADWLAAPTAGLVPSKMPTEPRWDQPEPGGTLPLLI